MSACSAYTSLDWTGLDRLHLVFVVFSWAPQFSASRVRHRVRVHETSTAVIRFLILVTEGFIAMCSNCICVREEEESIGGSGSGST